MRWMLPLASLRKSRVIPSIRIVCIGIGIVALPIPLHEIHVLYCSTHVRALMIRMLSAAKVAIHDLLIT